MIRWSLAQWWRPLQWVDLRRRWHGFILGRTARPVGAVVEVIIDWRAAQGFRGPELKYRIECLVDTHLTVSPSTTLMKRTAHDLPRGAVRIVIEENP